MDRRLFGFVAAGGVATVCNYLVFLTLLGLTEWPHIASAVGYISGTIISFKINKLIVFKDAKESSFFRYLLAYGLAMIAQLTLLSVLLTIGLKAEIANGLAIFIVVILNFFLVRRIAFS